MTIQNRLSGIILISFLFAASGIMANEKPDMKGDKTGTNPINFTYDARVYNEYQWLNTKGDGNQNITTFEYRVPIAEGKWQFRARVRRADIDADVNNDGIDDMDDSGWGDSDIRFLTVPYLNFEEKIAIAFGIEAFFDTASDDTLGSGTTSLGPQVFALFFKPFGGMFDIIAPAYQYKFSVEENSGRDEVRQGLIDLYFLKKSKDKQRWALIDPQVVLDFENDTEYMFVDVEVGTMLDKYLGTKGHSAYIRPSVSIGNDRPTESSIEFGYKVVW